MSDLPRLISRTDAAKYLGVSEPTFDRMIRLGVLPRRVTGTKWYDRKAIDSWLDKASDLTPPSVEANVSPVKKPQGMSTKAWIAKLHAEHQNKGGEGVRQ